MRSRSLGIAVLAIGLGALSACTMVQGDELDETPVHSASYSPMQGKLADGREAAQLWWRYELNQGRPITISSPDVQLSLTPRPARVIVEPAMQRRRIEVGGTVKALGASGASGDFEMRVEQELALGDVSSVVEERSRITERLTAQGEALQITIEVIATPQAGSEWVLDRTDLGVQPDGMRFDSALGWTISGQVEARAAGAVEREPIEARNITTSDAWIIRGKPSRVSVRGVEHEAAVLVERQTQRPDPTSGIPTAASVNYYAVAGVGIVRAINLIDLPGESDVVWDLIDSNLQPDP